MLTVALIVSGAVWAQQPQPDVFLNLWAAPTISTEKRYSAGTFDSDVDNYIDPTVFNGQIGTFMFAGGFPGGIGNETTDTLTGFPNTGFTNKDTVSLGFAKSLEANYLAVYYGGSFVNAYGTKTAPVDPVKASTQHDATWRNNLAVLFGIGSMGFTFDLMMDNTQEHYESYDGKLSAQTVGSAPTVALGWGAVIEDKLTPWVKFGLKFPDTTVITDALVDKATKKATTYKGAIFGLEAGARYGLNDTSSFLGSLNIGAVFKDSVKGDVKDLMGEDPYTTGGSLGADVYLKYTKALTFGDNVTVKIKPNAGIVFITESNSDSRSDKKIAADNYFSLGAGIDIGAEYVYDKIALYTGLGLRCFEWRTHGQSGGEDKKYDSQWSFTGLAWNEQLFGTATGSLGFGLIFTPIEGLVFGAGVNVGALFNPVLMTINNANSSGAVGFWQNTSLSITVSYKFANKAKDAEDAEGTQE